MFLAQSHHRGWSWNYSMVLCNMTSHGGCLAKIRGHVVTQHHSVLRSYTIVMEQAVAWAHQWIKDVLPDNTSYIKPPPSALSIGLSCPSRACMCSW